MCRPVETVSAFYIQYSCTVVLQSRVRVPQGRPLSGKSEVVDQDVDFVAQFNHCGLCGPTVSCVKSARANKTEKNKNRRVGVRCPGSGGESAVRLGPGGGRADLTPPRPHSAAAPELRTLAAAPPGGGPGSICVELTRSPHNPATRETREPLASRQPRDPGLYAASPYQCTVPRRSRLTLALADTRRASVACHVGYHF